MNNSFAQRFTGWTFIASALMLWLGWVLLPVRIGAFFEPDVFGPIQEQFHLWIWLYRVHLFGLIMAVVALTAFVAQVTASPARVLIWPGVSVAAAGLLVTALGSAFYYHHGAWGSLELAGKSAQDARAFVDALRVDTEYVTCLTRFGRVFGGLGLVLFAWGVVRGKHLPAWTGFVAGVLGVAAMALTMGLPDDLELFAPVFHVFALWLAMVGVVIVRGGVRE